MLIGRYMAFRISSSGVGVGDIGGEGSGRLVVGDAMRVAVGTGESSARSVGAVKGFAK